MFGHGTWEIFLEWSSIVGCSLGAERDFARLLQLSTYRDAHEKAHAGTDVTQICTHTHTHTCVCVCVCVHMCVCVLVNF